MKPHLKYRDGLWECSGTYERGTGFGHSPMAAYGAWLMSEPGYSVPLNGADDG